MINVYLNDTEITQYTINTDNIKYSIGGFGQLITLDNFNIELDNRLGIFDPNSPNSPLYNNPLIDHTITIFQNSVRTIDGRIQSVSADNKSKTSTITITPSKTLKLLNKCIYSSVDFYNPAYLARDICNLYKIDYDVGSFAESEGYYLLDSVQTGAYFQGETSIKEALQLIAEIGVARLYIYNNKIYYKLYNKTNPNIPTLYDFSDETIGGVVSVWDTPNSVSIEKEKITGYDIKYINEGSATFNADLQANKTLSGTYSDPVRIKNINTAIWIGEKWLDYLRYSQRRVTFSCHPNIGKSLSLYDLIGLDYENKSAVYNIVGIEYEESKTQIIAENVIYE